MNLSKNPLTALQHLAEAAPLKPLGWFRWPHHAYWIRLSSRPTHLPQDEIVELCASLTESWSELPSEYMPLLMSVFARHSWTLGALRGVSVAGSCWSIVDARVRGNFLAGFSGNAKESMARAWIEQYLEDAMLEPQAACELAVNAVVYKDAGLLAMALSKAQKLDEVIERMEPPEGGNRWQEHTRLLSNRAIDMILEACLQRDFVEGVGLALQYGANPDLPIWRLERSFNERYCALAFAISECSPEVTRQLLEAGANPRGTEFSGWNHPLFLALQCGKHDLAKQLIAAGASFQKEPAATIGAEAGKFYGVFEEEINWVKAELGRLVPLTPVDRKVSFYRGDAQGGAHRLLVPSVVGWRDSWERIPEYEALGLDTRLCPEEICLLIQRNAVRSLGYLLEKHGKEVCKKAFRRIQQRNPSFGQNA